MNDDWSRCPICYEDYSLKNRPTTFLCGHSTCINHVLNFNRLSECPICRFSLKDQKVFNISYNLEEAVHFYRMNKSPYADDAPSHITMNSIGEEHNEETNPRPSAILALILATVSRWNRNKPEEPHQKECGHSCYLRTTISCCSCSDQRAYTKDNQYEIYVDGCGFQSIAQRNQHYCPSCKQHD